MSMVVNTMLGDQSVVYDEQAARFGQSQILTSPHSLSHNKQPANQQRGIPSELRHMHDNSIVTNALNRPSLPASQFNGSFQMSSPYCSAGNV